MSDMDAHGVPGARKGVVRNIGAGPAVNVAAVYIKQATPERGAYNAGVSRYPGIAAGVGLLSAGYSMRDIPAAALEASFGRVVNPFCIYEDVFGDRYLWESGSGFGADAWLASGKEPCWASLYRAVFEYSGIRFEMGGGYRPLDEARYL